MAHRAGGNMQKDELLRTIPAYRLIGLGKTEFYKLKKLEGFPLPIYFKNKKRPYYYRKEIKEFIYAQFLKD